MGGGVFHALCSLIFQVSLRLRSRPACPLWHVVKCVCDVQRVESQRDVTLTTADGNLTFTGLRMFFCFLPEWVGHRRKRRRMSCSPGRITHKWRSHLLLLSLYTLHASFVFLPHSHTRLFHSAARPSRLSVSAAQTAVGDAFYSEFSAASCWVTGQHVDSLVRMIFVRYWNMSISSSCLWWCL